MSRSREQELSAGLAGLQYEPLPSLPEAEIQSPELVGRESYEWAAISNLDAFFAKVYRYWHDKGMTNILVSRLLNLAALAFTILFSSFLLLFVDWGALRDPCIHAGTCDILSVALHSHPLAKKSSAYVALAALYLGVVGLYWLWTLAHFVSDMRDVAEVKHFANNKLGISERQMRLMTWSEVVRRLVLVQSTTRLCSARDLTEADIVGRIMRKENYLIGMLNRGVLALHLPPVCGMRRRFMLTKTLEWNLYWCVLDAMFDDNFHIRQDFLLDERRLRSRLRAAALANLAASPFLFLFLIIYFFMRNAERFYHHPGSVGSRRWSALAKWRLREFNELPHYVVHRLAASHEAACAYVAQFPSPLVTQVAKFVAFVAGSFAALLLGITLLDEQLLERPLAGRLLVWWLATTGIVLTISRTFISENPVAYDPERAMAELAAHTHYLPRHWRGRAHTAEVQSAFGSLFGLKLLLFAEELASVILTPFILYFSLPRCAGAILQFVRDTTLRVDGVGDICSMAAFDFARHGNSKYGAPSHSTKDARSKQGKMEKSFLTFVATYPTWNPGPAGKHMLATLSAHTEAATTANMAATMAASMHMAAGGGAGYGAACAGMGQGASMHTAPAPAAAAPAASAGVGVSGGGGVAAGFSGRSSPSSSARAAGGLFGSGAGAAAVQVHSDTQQQQHGRQQQGQPEDAGPLHQQEQQPEQQQHEEKQQQHHQGDPLSHDLPEQPSTNHRAGAASEAPPWQGHAPTPPGGSSPERPPLPRNAGSPLPPAAFRQQQRQQQQQHHQHQLQHHQQQQPNVASNLGSFMQPGLHLGGVQQPQQQRWQQQQQQQSQHQQQQQQPNHHTLNIYPSTLYPGGPSAYHYLPHMQAFAAHNSMWGHTGPPGGSGFTASPASLMMMGNPAASGLFGFGAASAGSDSILPTNETTDLGSRVAIGQSMLQSFYESQDLTVQHRQQHRLHSARSVSGVGALNGFSGLDALQISALGGAHGPAAANGLQGGVSFGGGVSFMGAASAAAAGMAGGGMTGQQAVFAPGAGATAAAHDVALGPGPGLALL